MVTHKGQAKSDVDTVEELGICLVGNDACAEEMKDGQNKLL